MDNQVWPRVLAGFEEKQRQNQREEERRMAEISARCPDLARLVEERHQMVLGSVRSAFSGGGGREAEARMAEYNQTIARALEEKGYPGDYLAPVCQCPLCGDSGFVYDHSLRRPCQCLQAAYQEALAQAGKDTLPTQAFRFFDESRFPDTPLPGTDVTQREYMRIVRDRCRQYADGVPGGPVKTLLLHGGSGLGKTFLLHCVGNAALEKGVGAVYVTAYDLLMDLKEAYFSRGGDGAARYFDADLLLIDDLGMEPLMENITVEQIYNLVNHRLSRGLYTALSTNLSREEIKNRYTERLSSRLLDAHSAMAIPFQGKDIRLLRSGGA